MKRTTTFFVLLLVFSLGWIPFAYAENPESSNDEKQNTLDDFRFKIAFLPLKNADRDKDYEYLETFIMEAIYTSIQSQEKFDVVPIELGKRVSIRHRISSWNIDTEEKMLRLYDETGAHLVLFGNFEVNPDDEMLKITVKMLSLLRGEIVFDKTFESSSVSIYETVDEIAFDYTDIIVEKYDPQSGTAFEEEKQLREKLKQRAESIRKRNLKTYYSSGVGFSGIRIGPLGVFSLQFNTGANETLHYGWGFGGTLEFYFLNVDLGLDTDIGFRVDVMEHIRGLKWNVTPMGSTQEIQGLIWADYLSIPAGLKFKTSQGLDVGAGWINIGITAGAVVNVLLGRSYYSQTHGKSYHFYNETRFQEVLATFDSNSSVDDLAIAEAQGFFSYNIGWMAGISFSFLFNLGEITLEALYMRDIIPSLNHDTLFIPMSVDTDVIPEYDIPLPDRIILQSIRFSVSYTIPFYLFSGRKVYDLYKYDKEGNENE